MTEGETDTLFQLTTDPSMTELVVGPLHPFYIYHCTIQAFTVEGGPNTTVISIRTEEDGMCHLDLILREKAKHLRFLKAKAKFQSTNNFETIYEVQSSIA